MSRPMVSVHMPKTAGTTFATLLADQGSRSAFWRDYGDRPLQRSSMTRRVLALKAGILQASLGEGDCVHGHFLAYKYRRTLMAGGVFVTWQRDPVERLRSHYDFWRDRHSPQASDVLHQRMLTERWSFERFALGAELRNVYSQFLWRFPLSHFAFVGITEFFANDLEIFTRRFPQFAEISVARQNDRKDTAPAIEASLRARIENWHAKDVALYQQALAWRDAGRWR